MLKPLNSSGLYLWVGSTPQEGTVFIQRRDVPGSMNVREYANYLRALGKKVTLVHPLTVIPSATEEEDADQS